MARQVTCINKQDRDNPRERITHLGGVGFRVTQEQAIQDIKRDSQSYYTQVNGKSVWLVVSTSRYGNEYVRTQDDNESQNNLLSLSNCPVTLLS